MINVLIKTKLPASQFKIFSGKNFIPVFCENVSKLVVFGSGFVLGYNVCADLCQSLCKAGRLSLREGQEEGLLPERSESWDITKGKVKRVSSEQLQKIMKRK